MSGNWLGLVELSLVLFSVLGWAIYELYALRDKPPSESRSGETGKTIDEQDPPAHDGEPASAAPPRHPERQ